MDASTSGWIELHPETDTPSCREAQQRNPTISPISSHYTGTAPTLRDIITRRWNRDANDPETKKAFRERPPERGLASPTREATNGKTSL